MGYKVVRGGVRDVSADGGKPEAFDSAFHFASPLLPGNGNISKWFHEQLRHLKTLPIPVF